MDAPIFMILDDIKAMKASWHAVSAVHDIENIYMMRQTPTHIQDNGKRTFNDRRMDQCNQTIFCGDRYHVVWKKCRLWFICALNTKCANLMTSMHIHAANKQIRVRKFDVLHV